MKGVSTTKFCKGTHLPKHSGNFSPIKMHFCSRTYTMHLSANKTRLIIGNHTDAGELLPTELVRLMLTDKFFNSYRREGVFVHNKKEYKCWMDINKSVLSGYGSPDFRFRLSIDTQGEFDYNFPDL